MQYYNFWYINDAEVSRLWNQSGYPQSIHRVFENQRDTKKDIEVGIGNNNLIYATSEWSEEDLIHSLLQSQYEMTVEQKILQIISPEPLKDMKEFLFPFEGTKLIFAKGYFALWSLSFKDSPENNIINDVAKHTCNQDNMEWCFKYLPNYNLPIGFSRKRQSIQAMQYDIENIDFSKEEFDVDIKADGKKVCVNLRHLTNRIEGKRPFYFNILGHLDYIGGNKYQITPVAISR